MLCSIDYQSMREVMHFGLNKYPTADNLFLLSAYKPYRGILLSHIFIVFFSNGRF